MPTEISVAAASPTPAQSDNANLNAADAPVGVTFHAIGCPSSFDARAAEQDDLFAMCTSAIINFRVSLVVDGQGFETQSTPDDYGGYVFNNIPGGDFLLSSTVPPGFNGPVVVICYQANHSTTSITRFNVYGAAPFMLLDVQPGSDWYCYSFLVAQASGEIMLYVFGFPEQYDISTKSPEALKADCTGQFEGTEPVALSAYA